MSLFFGQQSLGVGAQSDCIADTDTFVWKGWNIVAELIFMTRTQRVCGFVDRFSHTHQFKLSKKSFQM